MQKTAFGLLVLAALRRFDAHIAAPASAVADAAFGIYFLHAPLMFTLISWAAPHLGASSPWPWHLAFMVLLLVLGLAVSVCLVRLLRAGLGGKSRWLLGA